MNDEFHSKGAEHEGKWDVILNVDPVDAALRCLHLHGSGSGELF